MRLRWDSVTWASWLLIYFGGTLVISALVLAIRGEDSAYVLIIIGVPVGLTGGVLLALRRRSMEPPPVTRQATLAANFLFVGLSLILNVVFAVMEQGRSVWLLLLPFPILGLGLYLLGRHRQ